MTATLYSDKGLGRLPAPDPNDAKFPLTAGLDPLIRAMLAAPVDATGLVLPKQKYWTTGPNLDQGSTPQCVEFSWTQNLLSSPLRQKPKFTRGQLYHAAQKIDEWPGENYDGTSVRAGVKVLQQWGYIEQYLWANKLEEVKVWILTKGPVVFGTNWYEGMFDTDENGYLNLTGPIVGGHAFLCVGYSTVHKAFRFMNSWGRAWGQLGRFWLREADVERLMWEDGEVCTAVEKAVVNV
jgi:hypothetical protein